VRTCKDCGCKKPLTDKYWRVNKRTNRYGDVCKLCKRVRGKRGSGRNALEQRQGKRYAKLVQTQRLCAGCARTLKLTQFSGEQRKCKVCTMADCRGMSWESVRDERQQRFYTRALGCRYYETVEDFISPKQKKCIDCGEAYPHTPEFFFRHDIRLLSRCKACHLDKVRKREHVDEHFRMKLRMATRMSTVLGAHAAKKSGRTMELLGCAVPELWEHLERQFVSGMSRENYGKVWHVDHIVPCDLFRLGDPAEQRLCFNYTNLQPLFAEENLSKHCRVSVKWGNYEKAIALVGYQRVHEYRGYDESTSAS